MVAKQNSAKKIKQDNQTVPKEKDLKLVHQVPGTNPSQFDRVIHERLRLGIVSALAVNEKLSFNQLKKLLDTTDGNLSVHSRKLEEANYIKCHKSFEGRTPKTEFELTQNGRKALKQYLDHMESLIASVRDER